MKRFIIYTIAALLAIVFGGCNDWLDRDPKTFLDDNKAYADRNSITAVITNLYNRLPDTGGNYQGINHHIEFDEAMSGIGQNDIRNYAKDYLHYYDYVLIRDINTFLAKMDNVSFLKEKEKAYYMAEGRFLRAYIYFELAKRMGGIPVIKELLIYNPGDDISRFRVPRNKEHEVYDFISTEITEIKNDLDSASFRQYNRASKGAALALKCRAMLYAGSLGKYNSAMGEPVTLPGQEVGIPKGLADGYYKEALATAQELMKLNVYSLYDKDSDKKANFYKALITSPAEGNNEAIFIKQFSSPTILHDWTTSNLPRTLSSGGTSGNGINPSLNLVDAFEMVDGSDGKLRAYTDPNHADETATASAGFDKNPDSYIHYENIADILNGKDNRLFGTVLTPGSSFKTQTLDIRAGIAYFNSKTSKYDYYEQGSNLSASNELVIDGEVITTAKTGYDGPSEADYITRTGFYVRKYLDEANSDLGSAIQFVRFRYGEVLLNAAEAAFELGGAANQQLALNYINQLRKRAGFTEDLKSLTIERIRNERRIELAFEGHRFYDLKRWRVAEEILNGDSQSKTAVLYGLWPYRVYRPGHETHNKWIFVRRKPAKFSIPRKFARMNYYSAFGDDELERNPTLVKNPGH